MGKKNILWGNQKLWKLEDQFQTNKQGMGVGYRVFLFSFVCFFKYSAFPDISEKSANNECDVVTPLQRNCALCMNASLY